MRLQALISHQGSKMWNTWVRFQVSLHPLPLYTDRCFSNYHMGYNVESHFQNTWPKLPLPCLQNSPPLTPCYGCPLSWWTPQDVAPKVCPRARTPGGGWLGGHPTSLTLGFGGEISPPSLLPNSWVWRTGLSSIPLMHTALGGQLGWAHHADFHLWGNKRICLLFLLFFLRNASGA